MLLVWTIISLLILLTSGFDYILNYDRVELTDYDRSLVKNEYFLFQKYNRTHFCLNVSFDLLQDLDGHNMKFTTSAFRLMSNQYKPMGYNLTFNVCKYWSKDIFGTTSDLSNYGNLEGCDIKKKHYYLYNYMPDERKFPKNVPLGSYMLQMHVIQSSGRSVLKFRWYITAKLKLKGYVIGG